MYFYLVNTADAMLMLMLLLLGVNPPIRNRHTHTLALLLTAVLMGMIDRDRRLETICKADRCRGRGGARPVQHTYTVLRTYYSPGAEDCLCRMY